MMNDDFNSPTLLALFYFFSLKMFNLINSADSVHNVTQRKNIIGLIISGP